MLKLHRALRALPVIALLLLTACAVNRQGNNFKFGIDVDELTASTLQEFQLGTARGVLRRTQQNQVQIKLYDRMKLIDLGQLSNVRIGDAIRFPKHDLILVHVPTSSCPYAYRLYQLSGYELGMWELNNVAGRCAAPLSFSADAQSWVAQQQAVRNPVAWAWSNGQLVSGPLPQAPAADAVNTARTGTIPAPGTATPADARPATGMRFESADGRSANAAASTASTARENSAPAPARVAATPAAPATAAAAPARASTPSAALKRVDSGSYARLPDAAGATVVPPTRIILRNSNGGGDAQ